MNIPTISLNSEVDSINEIENLAKTTFQHCHDMIRDTLIYSSDVNRDLMKLKMYMSSISESQKEMSGLIYATNKIYNLTEKVNLTEEEATSNFEETLNEYIDDNDIDDTQKDLLFSLDSYVTEELSETQRDDSDLLVTKAVKSYKDPLTQRTMVDPVRSKLCKHSYERDTIMTYLADKKKKCPYSGCQSKLSRRDLADDIVLKLKLSA